MSKTDKLNRWIVTALVGWAVWPIRGWIIATYWNWFLFESFGFPQFTIAHGLAVSLVTTSLISSKRAVDKEHSTIYYVICDVVICLAAWPIGWVFHLIWITLNMPQLLGWVP